VPTPDRAGGEPTTAPRPWFDATGKAGTVLLIGVAGDLLLGAAHVINQGGLPILDRSIMLFDLDAERSIPTWWASSKLLLIGVTFALMLPAWRGRWREWAIVALAAAAFLFLSLDEVASIHEAVGRRTRSEAFPVSGLWPFVYAATGLIAVSGLAIAGRVVWAADMVAAVTIVVGFVAYIGFAAVLDLANNVLVPGDARLGALVLAEEMGELLTASVILYGVVRLAAASAGDRFRPAGSARQPR